MLDDFKAFFYSLKIMGETSFIIHDWFINKLKLKSNELVLFALIFSFSKDGNSKYYGSLNYLMKVSGCTKPTVISSLNSLIEKGFIKKELSNNPNETNKYYVDLEVVKKLYQGSKEILPQVVKKFNSGSKEILPNNNINNNIDNNIIIEGENKFSDALQIDLIDSVNEVEKEKKVAPKKRKVFKKPTITEIEDYIYNLTNNINLSKLEAEKFFNYYESKGWIVGKSKMQKWKAAANGWLTRSKEYKKQETPNQKRTAAEELKQKLGLQ